MGSNTLLLSKDTRRALLAIADDTMPGAQRLDRLDEKTGFAPHRSHRPNK